MNWVVISIIQKLVSNQLRKTHFCSEKPITVTRIVHDGMMQMLQIQYCRRSTIK